MLVSSLKNTVSGAIRVAPFAMTSSRLRGAELGLDAGELGAVVDALTSLLRRGERDGLQPLAPGNGDGISQIIPVLGIGVADRIEDRQRAWRPSSAISPALQSVMARSASGPRVLAASTMAVSAPPSVTNRP